LSLDVACAANHATQAHADRSLSPLKYPASAATYYLKRIVGEEDRKYPDREAGLGAPSPGGGYVGGKSGIVSLVLQPDPDPRLSQTLAGHMESPWLEASLADTPHPLGSSVSRINPCRVTKAA